jgi:hypothetical protein
MYPSGPWPLKILMFALLVTREIATYSWPWEKTRDVKYMLGLLLILISKSWGCPPLGAGHAFPRQRHMHKGGGLFIYAKVFFRLWCHPWMDDGMDGWKASQKTTTTSFTICNFGWRLLKICPKKFSKMTCGSAFEYHFYYSRCWDRWKPHSTPQHRLIFTRDRPDVSLDGLLLITSNHFSSPKFMSMS